MNLIIDNRERQLLTTMELLQKEMKSSITYETSNLDIGDIVMKNEKDEYLLIIERKTIPDLLASIKDGRYNEQSFRLTNFTEIHNHNIIYLIEGSTKNLTKDKQMIYSSLFSLNYFKGFSVIKTENIQETAYFIFNSFQKLQKEKLKKPFYENNVHTSLQKHKIEHKIENEEEKKEDEPPQPSSSYCSFVKKKKNENITPLNFGEIILCQIPSINSVTAIAVMKEFKNINNLIASLQSDINCLDNLTYMTEKNQKRKISKTCIENIKKFLLIL